MGSERLTEYRRKRDFDRTAEPSGKEASRASGHRFVVQRHRASRLHYDLRLELDGVLVSWAVPKGPTLDPKARRMAVHVEDHPIEYVDFEGVIPEGEYGGGDVIVWDRGTWQPVDGADPARALDDGNLHFDLHGEKLSGRFVLVRPGGNRDPKQWLLLHKKDDDAATGWNPEEHPQSVKTGRTNDEVAADPEAMWRTDRPAESAETPVRRGGGKGGGKGGGRGGSTTVSGGAARQSTTASGKRRTGTRDRSGGRGGKGGGSSKASGRGRRWKPPTAAQLRALDELGGKGRWHVDGRDLVLTNLDKELFPGRDGAPPVTKRDLIRYHALIAPVMLPYLVDRPLNSHRFPQGVGESGFWHKEYPEHAPEWLRRWHYPAADADETQDYIVPDSVAALAWLANWAALELHPWSSRADDVDHPTWALFDIDPGSRTTFEDVLVLARLHRTALDHLGVVGKPKVTGQRGIQIWVPVEPRYTYAETRAWVESVSRAVGNVVPELVSWAWRKGDRRGLARLDYTQNVINKTLVAPYSARPAPGAPVSVPLEWDELDDPDLAPDRWTVRDVLDRVREVGDPFASLLDAQQRLPPP
ncbi:DNA polymerase ligase N-terminal domain-containing protein [Saccharopolyspora cebuensis]|uniref:non-homologous end-joining DNA ligase LigD n=1 Tax=Saccharopolyspora cebuensis TaxID=418759 RepID=UPI0031E9544A